MDLTERCAQRLEEAGIPVKTIYVVEADHMLLPRRQPIKPSLTEIDAEVIASLQKHLGVR